MLTRTVSTGPVKIGTPGKLKSFAPQTRTGPPARGAEYPLRYHRSYPIQTHCSSFKGPATAEGTRERKSSSEMEPTSEETATANIVAAACLAGALAIGAFFVRHHFLPKPPPVALGVSTSMSYLHEADGGNTSRTSHQSLMGSTKARSENTEGGVHPGDEWGFHSGQHSSALPAPFASVSSSTAGSLTRATDSLKLRMALVLQEVLMANVFVKVVAVCAAAMPLVIIFGLAYSHFSGDSVKWGVFKMYAVLYRAPGVNVMIERSIVAGLILNTVFVLSIFTFAVVLGIVGEEVKKQLSSVRDGNYPILAAHHTLVLGWNRQTIPLLRQMAVSGVHDNRAVIVLADRSKAAMDKEVEERLRGWGIKVWTRQGAPHFARDLANVAAGQAKTVIVLHPEEDLDAVGTKAATMMSLRHSRKALPMGVQGLQDVVVQTPEDHSDCNPAACTAKAQMDAARRACQGASMRVVEVSGTRDVTKIMAQTAVQRGVATVYTQLAQRAHGAPAFQIKDAPHKLVGCTYQEVRRSFLDAPVCGLHSSEENKLYLNPPETRKVAEGDRIVVLSRAKGALLPVNPSKWHDACGCPGEDLEHRASSAATSAPSRPQHIIVAGWGYDISDLVEGLAECAPTGTRVTVISPAVPEGLPLKAAGAAAATVQITDAEHAVGPAASLRCDFEHIADNPYSIKVLRDAGVGQANAVIIGGYESIPSKQADAKMLTNLLLIRDLMEAAERTKPAHIVAAVHHRETLEVADAVMRDHADRGITVELLHPDLIISGLVSQVAMEPILAPLLSELITDVGQEIYLRRPEKYQIDASRETTFAEVCELARLKRETAVGYFTAEGRLVLAPPAAQRRTFSPADRVVAIAEDWQVLPVEPTKGRSRRLRRPLMQRPLAAPVYR